MILYFVLVLVPNTLEDSIWLSPKKMRMKGMHTKQSNAHNARIYNFFEIKDSLNTIQGFSEEIFSSS